jgi:predicted  nucleic acid-binding Zn-ribbon protein
LREQLLSLLQLQTFDTKVKELQAAATNLPAKLDPLRRDLTKLQGMLDTERAKLAETETWRKGHQDMIDSDRVSMKMAQQKLQASKNTKEFSAASREVENKKKSVGDREGELKKVSDSMTASTTQLTTRDADVQKLRDELAESEGAMGGQIAELDARLAEAKTARDAARGAVEKSLLKTYDSLVGKRGYAVAPVVKGTCQGCHMALPPQLNNILARMQGIETCPRCGRLIYRKELLEPPAAEPTSDEAPKAE